jgi:phage major head subunit gpT-like protein
MRLLEMGRAFHEEVTGERLRGLSPLALATRLLGLETGLRGGMSTSDFPAILANVVVKRLRNAYETAPSNWKRLARQSNSSDFKEKAVTQLSNLPTFVKVKEGGEYQYAALSDGQEKYALATYGRIVPITRQTLINDDMGAFDRLPTLLGRAAAETEAGIFWQIVVANPAMSDGVVIFHADHGNLAAAGAAIAVDSLGAGRAAMRKQKGFAKKGADAEPLNVSPAFLIVSPDKETQAQQFLATIVPGEGGKVNPFANTLTLMAEARLSGNAWYLWADPATIDTVEYAYLDGEEGLYTEQRIGFEVDGLEVKGRLDFAAKAIDWRGVYKNPGA